MNRLPMFRNVKCQMNRLPVFRNVNFSYIASITWELQYLLIVPVDKRREYIVYRIYIKYDYTYLISVS